MTREDLVRMRRSLAMAPSLPASEALKLVDELERLMAGQALLERAREVIPQVLALLQELTGLTPST